MDKNIIPFVLKKCFFSLFYYFYGRKEAAGSVLGQYAVLSQKVFQFRLFQY